MEDMAKNTTQTHRDTKPDEYNGYSNLTEKKELIIDIDQNAEPTITL